MILVAVIFDGPLDYLPSVISNMIVFSQLSPNDEGYS